MKEGDWVKWTEAGKKVATMIAARSGLVLKDDGHGFLQVAFANPDRRGFGIKIWAHKTLLEPLKKTGGITNANG